MAWQVIDAEAAGAPHRDLTRVFRAGVFVLARDPVQPWESREVLRIYQPVRVLDLFASHGIDAVHAPVVLMINGLYYSRREWADLWIRPGDAGALMWLAAGGGGKTSRVIAGIIMIVVGAIIDWFTGGTGGNGLIYMGIAMIAGAMLMPKVNVPTPDSANALAAPSPTYNLQAQGNYARLNQAIPVIYGRCRIFMDFAAQPWGEFADNDQYLYQLFCIGQGYFSIEALQIEDQTLTATIDSDGIWRSDTPFEDISWQVVQPGDSVTYFPTRVLISDAVSQQELLTDESIGPYKITDDDVNYIGIDVIAPKGLYYANDNGGLDARGISIQVWAQRLAANGAAWLPTGDEILLGTIERSGATTTPQRISARYAVDEGRYQIRLVRKDAKDTSSRAGHDANWVGLKGYVPGVQQYGNLTLIAVRAKATNQLSSQSSRKFNVIATRMIPTWTPNDGWTAEVATRSAVWALADMLRNDQYGVGIDDTAMPLQDWYVLERDVLRSTESDGEVFDYSFDRQLAAWEAVGHISAAIRSLTYQRGPGFVTMRNQYRALPVALFNMRNIERGSFSIRMTLTDEMATDAVRVTYWDEQIWGYSTFLCQPEGVTADNPEDVTLTGVQRRAQAAKIGHYRARAKKLRRVFGTLRTELEGRMVKPGDVVAISHDMPEWGLSADLLNFTGTGKAAGDALTLTEPVEFVEGQTYYIILSRRNNSVSGPWRVVAGPNAEMVLLDEPINDASLQLYIGQQAERTRISFGPGQTYAARCLVLPPIRYKGRSVEFDFVEDDPAVYDESAVTVPDGDSTYSLDYSTVPVVRNLFVSAGGNSAAPALDLMWEATGNPSYYLVEISDDGEHYTRIAEPTSAHCRVACALGPVALRVAAVASVRGAWVNWAGNVATMMTTPANVSGLHLVNSISGTANQFADVEPVFAWDAAARADSYRVEVWSDSAQLATYERTEPGFTYSQTMARADGGLRRSLTVRVYGRNAAGESDQPAVLSVVNPQMAATALVMQQTGDLTLLLTVPRQTVADYAGTRFVVSQNDQANPATLALAADVPSWAAQVKVSANGTWYGWAANYDVFGSDNLAWSPIASVTIVARATGVQNVADVSTVVAAPGTEHSPLGDGYDAVFDVATGRMATWNAANGKYVFVPTESDVLGGITSATDPINTALENETAQRMAASAQAAADLQAEANARATAILNAQNTLTTLINTETAQRQSADESIATQISQVAAGTGTQFDSAKIWYFEADLESWNGNGAPTLTSDGMIRPANSATDPNVFSPVGVGIAATTYRFVKVRFKKVGAPGWEGHLFWRRTGDASFDGSRMVYVAQPAYDVNGIATLDFDAIQWDGTIDQIRIDLTNNQDANNYIAIDYVAIGRPTPGASTAALQAEAAARQAADSAEAIQRQTLATQVTGGYSGTDPTQLSQGLLYQMQQTLAATDSALATAQQALSVSLGGKASASDVTALTARVANTETGLTAQTTRTDAVVASLRGGDNMLPNAGFEADISGWTLGWKQVSTDANPVVTRDIAAPNWVPNGRHSIGIERAGSSAGIQDFGVYSPIPVLPGQRYCASAYMACHRGDCQVGLEFLDANLGQINAEFDSAIVGLSAGSPSGGTDIANWTRMSVFGVAPANAAYAYFYIRTHPVAGQQDTYTFVTMPMLEQATASQTAPSPWSPSTAGLQAQISTVASAAGANTTALQQLSATVGQNSTAIVSVQAQAQATATAVSGTWGLVIDANGKVSSAKAYNNGTIASFKFTQDQILMSPTNAVGDQLFTSAYWTLQDGWVVEAVTATNGHPLANTGAQASATLWDGHYTGTDRRHVFITDVQRLPYNPGDVVRLRAYGLSYSAQACHVALQVYSDLLGTQMLGGVDLSWLNDSGWKDAQYTVPAGARAYRILIYNEGGTAWAGWCGIAMPSVTLAMGTSLIVDGGVTARTIASGAVTAEKISVSMLNAVSAYLGDAYTNGFMTAQGVSGAWGGFRTSASKWWYSADKGLVVAGNGAGGFFFEMRAAANCVLRMSDWGDCLLQFPGLQVDGAGNATFSGSVAAGATLSAPSGTLGTITAGLIRNATNTNRLNFNETGSGAVWTLNNVDRVWGDGHTNWSNQLAAMTLYPRNDGSLVTDGAAQDKAYYIYQGRTETTTDSDGNGSTTVVVANGVEFVVDTGIEMDTIQDAYNSTFHVDVTGWGIWFYNAGDFPSVADKLLVSGVAMQQIPIASGQNWGNATLHILFKMRLANVRVLDSALAAKLNGLSFIIYRHT